MSKGLNYIDLFAGAGGLSEGFVRAGFNPIAHIEMDKASCFSLKTRASFHYLKENDKMSDYVNYLKKEISRDQLYALIPKEILDSVINLPIGAKDNDQIFNSVDQLKENQEIDLIVGGPPCQAYSLVGRARSEDGMKSDPRNYLFFEYLKFLERYNPKMFVFENVLGLKSANEGKYFKTMLTLFKKQGYEVADFVLHADKFGVLQNRKRVVLIGYKKELNLTLPNLEPALTNQYTVNSIFEDLPEIEANDGIDRYSYYTTQKSNTYLNDAHIRNGIDILTQHISRPQTEQDKEIYRIVVDLWMNNRQRLNYANLPERLKTHANQSSFFDRFKVVASDLYSSQTVVAHISKDGHYYIHPDIRQKQIY